jgi:carboxymethylenebutenolidase
MKKLLLSLACGLFMLPMANAQTKTTCCAKPATEEFAAFASSQEFRSMHESPLPFTQVDTAGEMITYPVTGSDEEGHAYLIKSVKPSNKYLIVIHEWWGLNGYIKKKADDFSKTFPDVNILAVDLYDGQVAENPDDAAKYMEGVTTERATGLLKGALTFAGKKAEIQTIGWCFGGGWALQTAIMGGKNMKGCVMYYGMPETDKTKLKALKCDVLAIFAKKDTHVTPKLAADFSKNMKAAGKILVAKQFDAEHGFANPSSPAYNNKNAAIADKLALDFLKKHFYPKK